MVSRRRLRLLFSTVLVIATISVGHVLTSPAAGAAFERHVHGPAGPEGAAVAPATDGITVVVTDSNAWLGDRRTPRATSELVALAPDGTVMYYEADHDLYWDVDPVPGAPGTVEFVYADHLDGVDCAGVTGPADHGVNGTTWETYRAVREPGTCTRNGVERLDLHTGRSTTVWETYTPGKSTTRYHDVDRLDGERLVVADIYLDRVVIVNARSGDVEWAWNVSDAFHPDTAGPFPGDWTHLNDVEVLDDGRIMASLRNHDQVVFLGPTGPEAGWTLGGDDERRVLYEQHNPDYLPPAAGGPAVLVADSENDRVVEYQLGDGRWSRTWTWRDSRLRWPRDADRLPDGRTIVADSNGNRVVEVDRTGAVVWQFDVAFPYEVERLEPGDESVGGPSARAAGLRTRIDEGGFAWPVERRLPGPTLNPVLYVTPVWIGPVELLVIAVAAAAVAVWAALELRWLGVSRRYRPFR